ncbi:unnamed protein product [Porites lobata]|uniref:Uncharacterized protein n=1 Tax=Porites lobata TaxID=104759 RepID=A0ABN8NCF3_9CNID|nr:unnamed protein product [Porites lobata]
MPKKNGLGWKPAFTFPGLGGGIDIHKAIESAKKFKDWVFSKVLPSIRKYGQFILFDNPNNSMFQIENETELH